MELSEFKAQIARLESVYGKYHNEAIKAFWNSFRHLDISIFKKVVTRAIATNVNTKFPPGLDKFEIITAHFRDEIQATKATSRRSEHSNGNRVALKDIKSLLREAINAKH